ncbi:methyl-accepting chemotaxis protein [Crassaminicella thermophila]|nr:methyl-accepting chemotaxis protein [Crassaminicella thermophila]
MKSIKHQLIWVMLLLVLVPFIVSSFMGHYFISTNYEKEIKENNKMLANAVADQVSAFIDKAYTVTEEIVHNNDVKSFIAEKQKNVIVGTVQRNNYFDLLFIQGTDGMQTAKTRGVLGDRSNRWWFKKIMEDKKPFVSKSYYSKTGNIPVTSILIPIYDEDNNLKGIMGSDLKLDYLQMIIEKFSTGENKYACVIDGEGVVIAHIDKKQVSELYNYKNLTKTVLVKDINGKVVFDEKGNEKTEIQKIKIPNKLQEITNKALNGESGVVEYVDNNGSKVISAYTAIRLPGNSNHWAVITVQKKAEAMAFVTDVQKRNGFVAVGLILLVIFVAYKVSNRITKPIIYMMKLMEEASDGDLTVISNIKSNNEIGKLSESFNKMIKGMKKLIERISEMSKSIDESSELLAETTEESAAAIDEVARTIAEVANGANEQAKDIELGVDAASDLSQEIEKMSVQIKESKKYADQVYHINNKGIEAMKLLEDKTFESNEASKQVEKVVNDLSEKTKTIDHIVETIMSISEQTNLLALNAAIEAARAGDAGRGFAVVAEEVRKLAEGTGESSNNVREIITTIQNDVRFAQEAMQTSKIVVEEQNKAIQHTQETFKHIAKAVETIVDKINSMVYSVESISISKDKVMSVIQNVSNVSEETAASSQQVSASTEEQTASIEQLSSLAEELEQMVKELDETIKVFKLNDELKNNSILA